MNNNDELFTSWPITPAMKNLLAWDEKWTGAFAVGSEGLTLLLHTLSEELKAVDYFINLEDTQQFFEFLKKLIETKPQNSQVLKEINNIHADIFEKITLKRGFNFPAAKIAVEYLDFLNFLLAVDFRYLFSKPEMTFATKHFLMLSKVRFKSADYLTQFRHALLASFECKKFLEDHGVLLNVISNLAKSIKKKSAENNHQAVMQLLDILGVLTDRLQTSQDPNINISALQHSIQQKSRFIYRRFAPFVENRLLKYSYYKLFLTQAYQSSKNLTQLCQSDAYRKHCISKYNRFIDTYHCATNQFPSFLIEFKHNNQSQTDLDTVCIAMREMEIFVPWMKKNFDFKPNYNRSQFILHISGSEKDFLMDRFLFEREDSLKKSYSVKASYFLAENPSQIDPLLGLAYTFAVDSSLLAHEYIHHLTALYINNLELDLTLTEGLAELHSAGICSERHIRDLRNAVNDTFIFEFFKVRKFPFYFNALKWLAYLVNEQPQHLEEFLGFLQKNDMEGFCANLDTFIDNDLNRQAFVNWSQKQVTFCNSYLSHYPNGHQPPIIYLKEISAYLNQTQTLESPKIILTKRDLSSQYLALDLHETLKGSSLSFKDSRWQDMQGGSSLALTALVSGVASSMLDDLGLYHKDNYPSLPAYLNNGFKPFVFAVTSPGLNSVFFDQAVGEVEERFSRFFVYLVMNYLTVIIAQPINKSLAENIQNKALNFFIQMLVWTMLWNPSLFLAESSQLFSTLFLQVLQALCFKVGEESYQIGKRICSPFWQRKKPSAMSGEQAFLESDNDKQIYENKASLGHY